MLTTKYISTISFNSLPYLSKVLKQLFEERIINFYSFVWHYKESDEKKDHIHLFMVPNGRIDTDKLRERFFEFENNNELPLGVLPFVNSKFDDWFLYNSHNERYLTSKGLYRHYHYTADEFINSDEMQFTEYLHQINWQKLNGMERFISMINAGMSFTQIVATGLVPIQLISQYEKFYNTYCFSGGGLTKGGFIPPENPAES